MIELCEIHVDTKEVQKKLEGTTLKMNTIIVKMQHAVNRLAIKKAKSNFKAKFDANNHGKAVLEEKTKKILSSFKTVKNKRVKGATQVKNTAFHAKFLELGAEIHAKNYKYLTFKVDDNWVKVESVSLPARPFLKPAVDEVWNSAEAKKKQEEVLQKELDKYWNKAGAK